MFDYFSSYEDDRPKIFRYAYLYQLYLIPGQSHFFSKLYLTVELFNIFFTKATSKTIYK